MNSDVPASEQELSQDGSLQNDSDENSLDSHKTEESSDQVELSDDPELTRQLIDDSVDSGNDQSSTSSESNSKVSDTETRLQQLEKEYETLNSQYMRIAADFDNFRKRQTRDQDDLKIQLTCSTLSEILPIVDNFERARQQLKPESEEAQTLHRSYQGLYKQLVDVLKQQGVAPMRVVGQKFDPNLHEAVLREPNDQYEEDINIEELQRGYHLDGKVLRHALVKVSMGPGPNKVSQREEEEDKVEDNEVPDKDLSESE